MSLLICIMGLTETVKTVGKIVRIVIGSVKPTIFWIEAVKKMRVHA